MNRHADRFWWVAIGLLGAACAYLLHAYTSLYGQQTAYVYHPATDSLFEVSIAASLSPARKWQHLRPGASPSFGDVEGIGYVGQVKEIAQQKATEAQRMETCMHFLLEENYEGWKACLHPERSGESGGEQSQQILDTAELRRVGRVLLDSRTTERGKPNAFRKTLGAMAQDRVSRGGEYWPRSDLNPAQMLPPAWKELAPNVERGTGEVIPINILFFDHVPASQRGPGRPAVEMNVLEGALLIHGAAAAKLRTMGYEFEF